MVIISFQFHLILLSFVLHFSLFSSIHIGAPSWTLSIQPTKTLKEIPTVQRKVHEQKSKEMFFCEIWKELKIKRDNILDVMSTQIVGERKCVKVNYTLMIFTCMMLCCLLITQWKCSKHLSHTHIHMYLFFSLFKRDFLKNTL
jgi:hypothetical protein